jgi:hypothetical protein
MTVQPIAHDSASKVGVFDAIWALLIEACAELGGVNWEWQAADTAFEQA